MVNAVRPIAHHAIRDRAVLAITGALLLAGCRSAPPDTDATPEDPLYPQGLFFYDATTPSQQLRGRIIIADTLVIVEPDDDTCWRPERTVDPALREVDLRVFFCAGVPVGSAHSGLGSTRLIVNLRNPTLNSRWGRYVPRVEVDRNACVNPQRAANGRITCAQRATVNRASRGWQYGPLHVRRGSLPPADTGGVARR